MTSHLIVKIVSHLSVVVSRLLFISVLCQIPGGTSCRRFAQRQNSDPTGVFEEVADYPTGVFEEVDQNV